MQFSLHIHGSCLLRLSQASLLLPLLNIFRAPIMKPGISDPFPQPLRQIQGGLCTLFTFGIKMFLPQLKQVALYARSLSCNSEQRRL